MGNAIRLDSSLTINEIIVQHPEMIAVFNRLGFDTCCGGGVSLDEAAHREGVAVDTVLAELRRVLDQR